MSKNHFFAAAFSLAFVTGAARAESEASVLNEASALPLASLVAEIANASAAAPAKLAAAGEAFIVRGVQTNAYATRYALERTADGAHLDVEIAGRGVQHSPIAVGSVVVSNVVSTGVVLTAAGNAIAFVPNALGRALLHDERATA